MTVRAKRARKNRKSSGAMLFSSDYSLQQSFERKLCCASDEDAKHKLRHKRKLLKPIFSRRMQAKQQGIKKKTKHATSLALSCFKSSRHISKSHTTIRTDAPAPALRRQAPAPVHTRVCRHTGARTCAYHTRVRKHTYTHAHACIREKEKKIRACAHASHTCAQAHVHKHTHVCTQEKKEARV